ncbi:MAG: NAD-dependent epimerase/dehydratase family protein [Knoellia sp.]
MRGQRTLVTGGHGFIGLSLVEELLARGEEVTVLDPSPPPAGHAVSTADRARHAVGDVRDAEMVRLLVAEDFDCIYHLASVVGVDQYIEDPISVLDTNVVGTHVLLRAAAEQGTRVVLASTSEVYGRNPDVPWSEESDRVLGPTSVDRWAYSSSKAVAEHLAFGLMRQGGLRASIVRYFNIYGPGQRPAYTLSRAIHRTLNGRPPVVYDSGNQTRSFTFVGDAVEGTIRAAESEAALGRAFNIGSTFELSVLEATRVVCEAVGYEGDYARVSSLDRRAQYEDIDRRVPDVRRAAAELGFTATTEVAEGVRRTVEWARHNQRWLDLPDSGMG